MPLNDLIPPLRTMQLDTPTLAYDSDQESVDLNELPVFGIEDEGATRNNYQESGVDITQIVDMDREAMQNEKRVEEIDKEMRLFSLEDDEIAGFNFQDSKVDEIELQPPGVPFFELSTIYGKYSPASDVCKTLIILVSLDKKRFPEVSHSIKAVKVSTLQRPFLNEMIVSLSLSGN
ncbi:hypothetical protein SK128_004165 [Halocaridina rubra]|uniref:Uncharacterized protein n=1 Tax=Halocaridina rubra TaxID=373956 RepID=A0AAN8X8V9_HALRR